MTEKSLEDLKDELRKEIEDLKCIKRYIGLSVEKKSSKYLICFDGEEGKGYMVINYDKDVDENTIPYILEHIKSSAGLKEKIILTGVFRL